MYRYAMEQETAPCSVLMAMHSRGSVFLGVQADEVKFDGENKKTCTAVGGSDEFSVVATSGENLVVLEAPVGFVFSGESFAFSYVCFALLSPPPCSHTSSSARFCVAAAR